MGKIDFENLSVWGKAMDIVEKCITISENITQNNAHYRIASQLESAALCSAKHS